MSSTSLSGLKAGRVAMSKSKQQAKKTPKAKKSWGLKSTHSHIPSPSEYHYSKSIEAAIADRMQSMKDVSIELALWQQKVIQDGSPVSKFITHMRNSLLSRFVSIDMFVDNDEIHVETAVTAIVYSLDELERISKNSRAPEALEREMLAIAMIVDATKSILHRSNSWSLS